MNDHAHPEYDGPPPPPPSRWLVIVVEVVVTLVIAGLILLALASTKAGAAVVVPDHRMAVYPHSGAHAWEPVGHPRMVLAPKGSPAAHQIRHAYPGDLYRLTDGSHGIFTVTGVIDISHKTQGRLFDRRMHVERTSFFVYLDRVPR